MRSKIEKNGLYRSQEYIITFKYGLERALILNGISYCSFYLPKKKNSQNKIKESNE